MFRVYLETLTRSIWFRAAFDAAYAANLWSQLATNLPTVSKNCIPILHFKEITRRSRIAGHEYDGADGYVRLEQLLCSYDWSDSVRMQMESEFIKRPVGASAGLLGRRTQTRKRKFHGGV